MTQISRNLDICEVVLLSQSDEDGVLSLCPEVSLLRHGLE
jgi:hypothetical protein